LSSSRNFFLLLALRAKAPGAAVQADGTVDTRVGLGYKWDIVIHNRARVRARQNDWYDFSSIPIVRYQAPHEVQLSGGAFFSRYEYMDGWKNVCRPIVAFEPSWGLPKGLTLASRTAYERFMIYGGTDYNRYRQRLRLSWAGGWALYGGAEAFFTDHGYAITRYGGGVKRNLGKRDSIEFYYWYETRRLNGPGVRHMFATTFTVNFQGFARTCDRTKDQYGRRPEGLRPASARR
jgi:hypothetical protein